jgi:hypothetical protein
VQARKLSRSRHCKDDHCDFRAQLSDREEVIERLCLLLDCLGHEDHASIRRQRCLRLASGSLSLVLLSSIRCASIISINSARAATNLVPLRSLRRFCWQVRVLGLSCECSRLQPLERSIGDLCQRFQPRWLHASDAHDLQTYQQPSSEREGNLGDRTRVDHCVQVEGWFTGSHVALLG